MSIAATGMLQRTTFSINHIGSSVTLEFMIGSRLSLAPVGNIEITASLGEMLAVIIRTDNYHKLKK